MAADYARVQRSIWSDDDFRNLSALAQWLYFHLLTSQSLNYAGVTDWRPARIAALTNDMAAEDVERAALDLEVNGYIIVDRETEEVLVRSFVRNDGLMNQPNVTAAMVKAHGSVASQPIRSVVVHELKRLRKEFPDLKGWGRGEAMLLLRRASLPPVEARGLLPPNPSTNPSTNPSVRGSVRGSDNPSDKGSGTGSVKGCLTPSPSPSPSPSPYGSSQHHSSPEHDFAQNGTAGRLAPSDG